MAANKAETASVPKPFYLGSCHCGFVKYSVRLDLVNPSPQTGAVLTKCNCSICQKSGTLLAIPVPDSFRLLSPEGGREALRDYTFQAARAHHWLCPKCGIKCFLEGSYTSSEGSEVQFARINVLTLDGKEDGSPLDDLRLIKTVYWDGKVPGNFSKGTSKEPAEGGVW